MRHLQAPPDLRQIHVREPGCTDKIREWHALDGGQDLPLEDRPVDLRAQGSQYVPLALGQRCRRAGIELSMGARGCAYDNAVCEAFFKTLKSELIDRRSWPTKAETRHAVFELIETFYNRR
jgi:hypothetical protein